jgi:hypothetical protein
VDTECAAKDGGEEDGIGWRKESEGGRGEGGVGGGGGGGKMTKNKVGGGG